MALPISEIPSSQDLAKLDDDEAYAIVRTVVDALTSEIDDMDLARTYYNGEQALRYSTTEFNRAFGDQFADLKANWCDVVISATENRLEMDRIAYRPEEGGEIDDETTAAIWKVFQDNRIDVLENELYSSTMVEKRAAIIVWPGREGDDADVLMTANRAQVVKVLYEDDNPNRPLFAIKKWRTQLGEVFLTLYTKEWVYKYKIPKQYVDISDDIMQQASYEDSGWRHREPASTGDPTWPLANPFDEIPIVEFYARKNRSELLNVMPIQDAINKEIVNMLVASDYAAHMQSYIISSNAEPDGGWKRRPGEVWQIQPEVDLDGKALPTSVGVLPAEDPSNLIAVIEHLLAQLSNLSSTPGYYIFNSQSSGGRGDAPSGDSLKIGETTLIKKVEKYQQMFDPKWVKVGKLVHEALALTSKVKSKLPNYGEVNWSNPQKHFMGMLLEEGRKMIDELQLPPWVAWEHIGLSEAEIKDAKEHLEKMKAEAEAQMKAEVDAKAASSQPDISKSGTPKKTQDQLKTGSTSKNT